MSPNLLTRPALLVAAIGALLPATASAQPWEQVSVTSGPYTSATPSTFNAANAVGDLGRFVGFRAEFQNGQSGAFIRDIQSNLTTQPGGAGARQVFGIDRAETKALVVRDRGSFADVVATPLVGGGTSQVLYTSPASTGAWNSISGALSGDGSTALIADQKAGKVVKVDVASGATTYVQETGPANQPDAWQVGTQAISDDGTVFSLRRYTWVGDRFASRVYRTGQARLDVSGLASVSADGSTISWKDQTRTSPQWTLAVRKLATGSVKTAPPIEGYDPWISADGNRVIYGREDDPRTFDWSTGATAKLTGRFATFGGIRSPNGRFQLGRPGGQLYLFDTTNTHIVGANDPPTGDQYLTAYSSNWCPAPSPPYLPAGKRYGTFFVTLRDTAVPFAAKAVSANVTLAVDATTLKTAPLAVGQQVTADWKGNVTYGWVRGTVVDELGRTLPVSRRFSISAEYCG